MRLSIAGGCLHQPLLFWAMLVKLRSHRLAQVRVGCRSSLGLYVSLLPCRQLLALTVNRWCRLLPWRLLRPPVRDPSLLRRVMHPSMPLCVLPARLLPCRISSSPTGVVYGWAHLAQGSLKRYQMSALYNNRFGNVPDYQLSSANVRGGLTSPRGLFSEGYAP